MKYIMGGNRIPHVETRHRLLNAWCLWAHFLVRLNNDVNMMKVIGVGEYYAVVGFHLKSQFKTSILNVDGNGKPFIRGAGTS